MRTRGRAGSRECVCLFVCLFVCLVAARWASARLRRTLSRSQTRGTLGYHGVPMQVKPWSKSELQTIRTVLASTLSPYEAPLHRSASPMGTAALAGGAYSGGADQRAAAAGEAE